VPEICIDVPTPLGNKVFYLIIEPKLICGRWYGIWTVSRKSLHVSVTEYVIRHEPDDDGLMIDRTHARLTSDSGFEFPVLTRLEDIFLDGRRAETEVARRNEEPRLWNQDQIWRESM